MRRCAGSYGYSLFSCDVGISFTLRRIFSACCEIQVRMRRCAGSYGYSLFSCDVGISLTLRSIFSAGGEVQIRLRGCADSYGYSLFTCDVGTSLTFRRIFQQVAKSRSGCADAQAHMGIRCSPVTWGHLSR